jgi:hypothetical protein
MLDQNDLWLLEDELPLDEPADVLLTMQEVRQLFDPDRSDEELGLRSILEQPEALAEAWRRSAHVERHQRILKSAKRPIDALRAA